MDNIIYPLLYIKHIYTHTSGSKLYKITQINTVSCINIFWHPPDPSHPNLHLNNFYIYIPQRRTIPLVWQTQRNIKQKQNRSICHQNHFSTRTRLVLRHWWCWCSKQGKKVLFWLKLSNRRHLDEEKKKKERTNLSMPISVCY